jgi:hypothetical protein
MTREARAAQLWPLLAFAATHRQVLSYELVARLLGVPRPALGGFLAPSQDFCIRKGLPALTSLVVSETNGLPGEGFVAAADTPKAHADVFTHDWLATSSPGPDDLRNPASAGRNAAKRPQHLAAVAALVRTRIPCLDPPVPGLLWAEGAPGAGRDDGRGAAADSGSCPSANLGPIPPPGISLLTFGTE